jgi:hypothetical protein
MAITRRQLLSLAATAGAWPCAASAAVAELCVITNPSVQSGFLDELELEAIFTTVRRYWSGTQAIVPFNLVPRSDERVLFDHVVLRMNPDEVGRFWLDRRVRSGPPPPRQAPDAATAARLVARLEGAISYVPMPLVAPDVRVVARIRDGKVIRP